MNKPNFVCGAYNVTLEHPSDRNIELLISENVSQTLGGELVSDILSRKYKYNLGWKALSKDEYDDLLTLLNYHIDNVTPVTFTYPKWVSSASGVLCHVRYSKVEPIGGGTSDYKVAINLELTEISSRI